MPFLLRCPDILCFWGKCTAEEVFKKSYRSQNFDVGLTGGAQVGQRLETGARGSIAHTGLHHIYQVYIYHNLKLFKYPEMSGKDVYETVISTPSLDCNYSHNEYTQCLTKSVQLLFQPQK
jgi:hypothetical protein